LERGRISGFTVQAKNEKIYVLSWRKVDSSM
jgi:hypothetical protein